MAGAMTRRQGLPVKRLPETATFSTNTTVPPKSRFSPVVLFSLLLVEQTTLSVIVVKFVIDIYAVLVVIEVYQKTQHKELAIGQGSLRLIDDDADDAPVIAWDGDVASSQPECTAGVCGAIDVLQDMYGKTMHRLLHIGPGTCGVISKLLKESNSEVWGVQPFKMKEPVHKICHDLLRKGLIRVAEINRPLPYRSRSFSFVLVTDTLDMMKKRDLNVTLPELSRLSAHDLVVVIDKSRPARVENKAIVGQLLKPAKHRTRDWWLQQFHAAGLKEDEEKSTHFNAAMLENGNKTSYHIFHLIVPSFSISRQTPSSTMLKGSQALDNSSG